MAAATQPNAKKQKKIAKTSNLLILFSQSDLW